jgi:hypothetical protein
MKDRLDAAEHLSIKRAELRAVFEAHPNLDFSAEQLAEIQDRNKELIKLERSYDALRGRRHVDSRKMKRR